MKTYNLVAAILIAVGMLAPAYQALTGATKEKVVDLGPLQVTAEKTQTVPLPPIVGALAMAGGIGLLITAKKSPEARVRASRGARQCDSTSSTRTTRLSA